MQENSYFLFHGKFLNFPQNHQPVSKDLWRALAIKTLQLQSLSYCVVAHCQLHKTAIFSWLFLNLIKTSSGCYNYFNWKFHEL